MMLMKVMVRRKVGLMTKTGRTEMMKKVVTMRTSWGSNLVSGARQGSERRFLSKLLGQDPTLNLGQDPTLNSPLINYHLPPPARPAQRTQALPHEQITCSVPPHMRQEVTPWSNHR